MPLRSNYVRVISICIILTFILTCLINVLPSSLDSCNCENYLEEHKSYHKYRDLANKLYDDSLENLSDKPKLAILVPFRDRFEEMLEFVPYIAGFLNNQNVPHHIFILNQIDRLRFNRASLINVGFLYSRDKYDYIAMHDVDLLPLNNQLKYDYPKLGAFHVASPDLHPRYHYPTFVGGILLVKREDYQRVNGMSNKYWGWGLEDDEFYVRLKDAGIKVYRPENISTGTQNTFAHIHDRSHRKRDTTKCYNQREETRKRDNETGLNTLKYNITSRKELTVDGVKATILNIQLYCDRSKTPWCDCEGASESPKPKQNLRNKKSKR